MLSEIGAVLRSSDTTAILVECRHCGQTADPDVRECDACGRTEFARYELQ